MVLNHHILGLDTKRPVSPEVISGMAEKLKRLSIPRGFSVRPVLIRVNGVHEDVEESGFFSDIIDFSQLL